MRGLSILTGFVTVMGLVGCSQPATEGEPPPPPSLPSIPSAPAPPTTSAPDPHGARACELVRGAHLGGVGADASELSIVTAVSAVRQAVHEAAQANDAGLRISATYLRVRLADVVDLTGRPEDQERIDALKRAMDSFLETCRRSGL